jgi:hypothetical protein
MSCLQPSTSLVATAYICVGLVPDEPITNDPSVSLAVGVTRLVSPKGIDPNCAVSHRSPG